MRIKYKVGSVVIYLLTTIKPHFISVNGDWSSWSSWSSCSRSCNGGEKKRQRTCTNPSPVGLGTPCIGNSDQVSVCNRHPCPGSCLGLTLLKLGKSMLTYMLEGFPHALKISITFETYITLGKTFYSYMYKSCLGHH